MSQSTSIVGGSSSGAGKNDAFISRYASRFSLQLDRDWTIRECKLHILGMFLDGSIYDNLPPFSEEYAGGQGNYVKLNRRRPSVLYNLCKIVVDDSVGMLFGEGHFPRVECGEGHENTEKFLQYINRVSDIKTTMINAARFGAIGSVAIIVKVLDGKFYFDVLNSKHLTPVFDPNNPKKLIALNDKKKMDGASLMALGYDIPEDLKNKYYYLERDWNETEEIYYIPYLVEGEQSRTIYIGREEYKARKRKIDTERSTIHDLGFVPVIWIQNLPKAHHIDGLCTFEPVVDISIEIDYHLSQLGRGIYYNNDPTLVVKNPTTIDGTQFIKNLNIMQLDEKGDAYYAEVSGNATDAVINYVKTLREFGLEAARGNRASPEKMNAAQSGKAMRMLNNPLVSLVSEMRLTYGEWGLIQLYKMCLDIYKLKKSELDTEDYAPDSEDCSGHLVLDWPDWYPATGQDKLQEAQALQVYRSTNILSQESAINSIADEYNIIDVDDEISAIDKEKTQEQNRLNESTKVEPKSMSSSGA